MSELARSSGSPPAATLQARRESSERIVRADRRFAWATTFVPLLAAVLAVVLLFQGYTIGWVEIGIMATMYTLVTASQEIGWHRCFAHRAFEATRGTKLALGILGSMSFQGPLIWWVATHRRHHRYSDQPGDPHSPRPEGPGAAARLRGLIEGHSRWTFDPERARPAGWAVHAKDLYRDGGLFFVHYFYFYWLALGLLIPALAGGILTWSIQGAWMGLLWGGLVRIFISDHLVRALNSVGHTYGSRRYDTGDLSRNFAPLVIPTFGQGWHNNHHAFPHSAVMSHRWWQLDPGAWIIRLLERLGLVWNVRVPSRQLVAARQTH